MTPRLTQVNWTKRRRQSSPVGSTHESWPTLSHRQNQLLQSKGFPGGVPLNTETTAVKPRVGINR